LETQDATVLQCIIPKASEVLERLVWCAGLRFESNTNASTSDPGLSGVLQRLTLLEEQVQRHEEELATCLNGTHSGGDVSGIERLVKIDQLYRQGQELINGERHVVKDVRRGLSLLRESASFGHADSIFALAFYSPDGEVYPGRPAASADYYRTSALQGNSFGQFKYGRCLIEGKGIAADAREAVKYLKLSADQGNAYGQLEYGSCLQFGRGIAPNTTKAVKYCKLSADQGYHAGQFMYGTCLRLGVEIAVNETEAAKYYKLAADQGNAEARWAGNRLTGP
jgi:TPR repeat protein